MQSPFFTHRSKVLGHYGTAGWLRSIVLSMWNGADHHVRLDKLSSIDTEHFTAVTEMMRHFRLHGEADPAFQQLVKDVQERVNIERQAADRSLRFENWCSAAERELRRLGKSADLIDERYNWFESQFDAGVSAQSAAADCESIITPAE